MVSRLARNRDSDAPPEKPKVDPKSPFAGLLGPITADTGIVFVPIPAGTFTMGSPASEPGRQVNEGPQTQVTLTKAFFLGANDVTQRQYEAVMGINPSHFTSAGLEAPVESVSWNDAMEFCRKLTEKERAAGHLPAGYAFTLPTEAQWEYACRAGTTGPYAGDLEEMAWYGSNSESTTHPVGQKEPNAWGLRDMHGNVLNLCLDRYGSLPGGAVTDPTGPESGAWRVYRGGGWQETATYCRSAIRGAAAPGDRYDSLGFRLALNFLP
jgi:formylglycine-generating enzyme required for sulfatase activity